MLWESVVGGMVMVSTITYAVNGKQYVMVFTGEGQSLTSNVLALTTKVMPRLRHSAPPLPCLKQPVWIVQS